MVLYCCFISGKSTELQLTKCLKSWYNELNNKKCFYIIYIDFAKAFDFISHEKLLYKLKSYIRGKSPITDP